MLSRDLCFRSSYVIVRHLALFLSCSIGVFWLEPFRFSHITLSVVRFFSSTSRFISVHPSQPNAAFNILTSATRLQTFVSTKKNEKEKIILNASLRVPEGFFLKKRTIGFPYWCVFAMEFRGVNWSKNSKKTEKINPENEKIKNKKGLFIWYRGNILERAWIRLLSNFRILTFFAWKKKGNGV